MITINTIIIDADAKTVEEIKCPAGDDLIEKMEEILLHFDIGLTSPFMSRRDILAIFEEGPEPGEHNMADIGDAKGFTGRTLLVGDDEGRDFYFDVPLTLEEARSQVRFYRGTEPPARRYTARYGIPPLRSAEAIARTSIAIAYLLDPQDQSIRPVEIDPRDPYTAVEKLYDNRFEADLIDLRNDAAVVYARGPLNDGEEYYFLECYGRRHIAGRALFCGYRDGEFVSPALSLREMEMYTRFYRGLFVGWHERGPFMGYEPVVEVEGKRTQAGWVPGKRHGVF